MTLPAQLHYCSSVTRRQSFLITLMHIFTILHRGYNIGIRLIDEFLAKAKIGR